MTIAHRFRVCVKKPDLSAEGANVKAQGNALGKRPKKIQALKARNS
jgi:hypothetical protein